MKKTFLYDVRAFLSRKTGGLAGFVLAAAGLLSVLSLPLRADDAADRKIAADMNSRGFDLFRLVSEKNTKENSFISPYSIDSAFGMVYCGALDRTAQEIRTTLGLPAAPAECGRFFDAVSRDYAANKAVEILVSNSVWYEQTYAKQILPSFLGMIEKYYGGTFYKEDFSKPGPLVSKVNAYVEERTKNMIKDLLSPSDITDKTFMILLNTLYFEAKWKTPFRKEETRPAIFRNFDGREKRVRMMYRRGFDIGYCFNEEDNVHAVVLPYEDPRFELIALMPIRPGEDQGASAMKDIVAKLGDKLDTWLANRSPFETRLWLPVADLTCKYSLKEDLEKLGMLTPFSETRANFHGIAEPGQDESLKYIWIEKVIHKTALKMDEVSTKAAAATAIIMGSFGGGMISQPPPVNIFRADRPYLVLIRDNQTGLILFAGRINDPGVEATEEDGPVMPSFGFPPSGPGSNAPGANSFPGFRPAAPNTIRPGSATTQTSKPAEEKVDGARKKQDIFAGVPLWNPEQDGPPEIRLRELVSDAAKRAEADLKTLSAVRTTSFDAEHSSADVDFVITDEYRKIVRFIDEVEKQTPHLSWRRVEIRVEPATGRFRIEEKPKDDATSATAARQYRLTGQIRVIKYTPAKKETVPAAATVSLKELKEKAKSPVSVSFGDPDFLAKLYDLSLALPESAVVTLLRFNDGNCDLQIQAQDRHTTPDQYMIFPYWAIARLSQRIISNDIFTYSISLVRKDDPAQPHQDGVTRDRIATIAALNIFDPDRTPKKSADSGRPAVLPGSMVIRSDEILKRQLEDVKRTRTELESLLNSLQQTQGGLTKEQTVLFRLHIESYDQRIEHIQEQLKALRMTTTESGEADLERQLKEADKNHAELDSLHRTLEQTPGATKEQIELVRQRLERSEQRVRQLQNQLKKLRP